MMSATAQDGVIKGKWQSEGDIFQKGGNKDTWVQLEITLNGNEKLYFGRPYKDFEQHKGENNQVRFWISTEAGELEFTGDLRRPKKGGEFTFRPDDKYVEEVKTAIGSDISLSDTLRLAIFNVPLDYIKAM